MSNRKKHKPNLLRLTDEDVTHAILALSDQPPASIKDSVRIVLESFINKHGIGPEDCGVF